MPFLGRRIRENLLLFLAMGLLYFVIYTNVHMPDTAHALPISYGGALVVALFVYVYCLYTYLINVGDLHEYIIVNVIAYAVYAVLYYVCYTANVFLGGVFGYIYRYFFLPFGVFGFLGMSVVFSSIIVHLIYLAAIFVVPFCVRDTYDPTEEYFNRVDEGQ